MAVCHHYRISHSEFLSWPREDRDKAIWWQARENQSCTRCGTRAEEWDPKRGGTLRAYTVETRICRGCQALDQRAGELEGNNEKGLQIALRPNRE